MLPGGIPSGVEDTGYAMGCLQGEGYLPVKGVKGDSVVDQVSNSVGGFTRQDTYYLLITQAIAGGDGVPKVKLW